MNKNLKSNNGFSVFNTSTFNVIRRRYSLQEVPWRRIRNAIAKAMSICVAFSNKVMDTPELPQPIKRYEAPKYDIYCVGRSMIEMLGVLAIIAVLSVGGIAGYSKAMMKWKSNVQKNMLAELLTNMIKIRPNLNKKSTSLDNITYVFEAMGALPEGITYKNNYMYDKEGNRIWIDYGLSSWTNEDGSIGTQFSYVVRFNYKIGTGHLTIAAKDFCLNLLEAAKTIAEDVVYIKTNYNDSSTWNGSGQNIMYTKKSFAAAAMADMQQKCNMVINEDGGVKFSLLINPY